jgi:hypothetical protein
MSSRRRFLGAAASVASGSALLDDDLDLDDLYREVFASAAGCEDQRIVDVDGTAYGQLQGAGIRAEPRSVDGGEAQLYYWQDQIGLSLEVEGPDLLSSTTVSMTAEEARELRDVLDGAIRLSEGYRAEVERDIDEGEHGGS